VDAADRGERDAPPADGREGSPLARRVVCTRAVVAELPDRRDVARVAADQGRRQLLADQGDDGRVVAEVPDGGLGLAEPDEAGVRLDLDEAHVERVVPAEVADVRAIGGDGGAKPRGADGGDEHGAVLRVRRTARGRARRRRGPPASARDRPRGWRRRGRPYPLLRPGSAARECGSPPWSRG